MTGLVATKQQFIDAIFKLATEEDTWKRWNLSGTPWNSGNVFAALEAVGFVLLNKKALQKRAELGIEFGDLVVKHFIESEILEGKTE